MGTSVDAVRVEKLQDDIRVACRSLEQCGYDSLVIVVSQDTLMKIGSESGRRFIDSFDLVQEFARFCEDLQQKVDIAHNLGKQEPGKLKTGRLVKEVGETYMLENQALFVVEDSNQASVNCISEDSSISEEREALEKDGFGTDHHLNNGLRTNEAAKGVKMEKDNLIVVKPLPTLFKAQKNADRIKETEASATQRETSSKNLPRNTVKRPRCEKFEQNTAKKIFKCDKCDKTFARQENLTHHIRSKHTGEKPYKCRECEKAFVSRGQLNNHMDTHSDRTPYVCDVCGQLFKRSDYLWRHKAIHLDGYRYTCEVCGRGYDDASSLKNHTMRQHTGEKPHSCEVCGKAFLARSVLVSHIRTHTGEKPFPCEICGQNFRMKKNLTTHQRNKHAA